MDLSILSDKQKQVVMNNTNLLVSAGAGSGKTFVLTKRVVNKLLDPVNPVPANRLLIVTFTVAASAEMKDRIMQALDEEIKVADSKEVINRITQQKYLLNEAIISTIDSFASWILKNYADKTDVDPEYRIAENNELTLLYKEAFTSALDKLLGTNDSEFLTFVNNYSNGKSFDSLFDIVKELYDKTMSFADVNKYINYLLDKLNYSVNEINKLDFSVYLKKLKGINEHCKNQFSKFEKDIRDEKLKNVFYQDMDVLNKIANIKDYNDFVDIIQNGFCRMSSGKSLNVAESVYKDNRSVILYDLKKILKSFDLADETVQLDSINKSNKDLVQLIRLLREFMGELDILKKESRILEFNDIEHEAYYLLRDNDSVREEISSKFDEIMVDEYQDTNDLQDSIFALVSNGKKNIFMVGDVKQSIYGFRNASPELFVNHYKDYETDPSQGTKIDLTDNYRCRKSVVDSVNTVMNELMITEFGDIDYKNDAQLVFGSKDYTVPDTLDNKTEIIECICSNSGDKKFNNEIEAVIRKIKSLVGNLDIYDKNTKEIRKCTYKDIVLLSRSTTRWNNYKKKLIASNIPCYVSKSDGYFDSKEILLMKSILTAIDNPLSDISLAAFMLSKAGGFSNEELLEIKSGASNKLYYSVLYPRENLNQFLKDKCSNFISLLNIFREKSKYLTVYELIDEILDKTGLYYYIESLKDGKKRVANINKLKTLAKDFEKTYLSGLSSFIEYINTINKLDLKEEEIGTLSEKDDVVRFMTIHKSKGLEFPVVFIIDAGKNLFSNNTSDTLAFSNQFGIASNYYNSEKQYQIKTLTKQLSKLENEIKEISEEIRLLYVAMTRAREKLIIVGTRDEDFEFNEYLTAYYNIIHSKTYLDWILGAYSMANHPDSLSIIAINDNIDSVIPNPTTSYAAKAITNTILNADEIIKNLSYEYEHINSTKIKGTYSVSDIKKLAYEADDEAAGREKFYKKSKGKSSSALLGTAYHLLLEKIDPSRADDISYIKDLIDTYHNKGFIAENEYNQIDAKLIEAFYDSEIGRKVIKSYQLGKLFRERPFVLGISPSVIDKNCDDDEKVIIQGIIDMYYIDENGITIIDYKSDGIKEGQEQELIDRYKMQIDYYAKALEAGYSNLEIYKKYIYSIPLKKFLVI